MTERERGRRIIWLTVAALLVGGSARIVVDAWTLFGLWMGWAP